MPDVFEYPPGPHEEFHKGEEVTHPGYFTRVCQCGRRYPVGRAGYEPGWCGDYDCPYNPNKKEG